MMARQDVRLIIHTIERGAPFFRVSLERREVDAFKVGGNAGLLQLSYFMLDCTT